MTLSIVPVCGRFDNAPEHIIIDSTMYATKQVGWHGDGGLSDDEYEQRKEQREKANALASEAKRVAYLELLASREAKRRIDDERDRALRAERSKENQKIARRNRSSAEPKPDEVWLDTRPAKRKRNRKVEHKINPMFDREDTKPKVPEGYERLQDAEGLLSVPGMIIAIKRGAVDAVKIARQWYVNTESARAYVADSADRKKRNARASLQKARDVRFGPKT